VYLPVGTAASRKGKDVRQKIFGWILGDNGSPARLRSYARSNVILEALVLQLQSSQMQNIEKQQCFVSLSVVSVGFDKAYNNFFYGTILIVMNETIQQTDYDQSSSKRMIIYHYS
jgi:hypothetical protein